MGLALGFIAVFCELLTLGQISYLSLAFVPMAIAGGMQANAFMDIVSTEGGREGRVHHGRGHTGCTRSDSRRCNYKCCWHLLHYIPYVLGIVGVAFATVVTIEALGRLYMVQSLIRKPTVANVRSLMWTAAFMAFGPIGLLTSAFLG